MLVNLCISSSLHSARRHAHDASDLHWIDYLTDWVTWCLLNWLLQWLTDKLTDFFREWPLGLMAPTSRLCRDAYVLLRSQLTVLAGCIILRSYTCLLYLSVVRVFKHVILISSRPLSSFTPIRIKLLYGLRHHIHLRKSAQLD